MFKLRIVGGFASGYTVDVCHKVICVVHSGLIYFLTFTISEVYSVEDQTVGKRAICVIERFCCGAFSNFSEWFLSWTVDISGFYAPDGFSVFITLSSGGIPMLSVGFHVFTDSDDLVNCILIFSFSFLLFFGTVFVLGVVCIVALSDQVPMVHKYVGIIHNLLVSILAQSFPVSFGV